MLTDEHLGNYVIVSLGNYAIVHTESLAPVLDWSVQALRARTQQ